MCWIGEIKNHKIAEKDIVCYKLVSNPKFKRKFLFFGKKLTSVGAPYRDNFKYKINVLNTPVLIQPKVYEDLQYCAIYEGYHSLTHDYNPNLSPYLMREKNDIVVKCIIPKGTLYYYNKSEYVSENIIVTDEITPFYEDN